MNDYESIEHGGFCTECGLRVESFAGLTACPHCGTTGLPCGDEDQVNVSVNWHELHILVVWAENYSHGRTISGPHGKPGVIYSIARRLEKQFPKRHRLSLAGEIGQIKEEFGRENVETNIPGVE